MKNKAKPLSGNEHVSLIKKLTHLQTVLLSGNNLKDGLKYAQEIINLDALALYIPNDSTGELEPLGPRNNKKLNSLIHPVNGLSLIESVYQSGKTFSSVLPVTYSSVWAAPLKSNQKKKGIFIAVRRKGKEPFTPVDKGLLLHISKLLEYILATQYSHEITEDRINPITQLIDLQHILMNKNDIDEIVEEVIGRLKTSLGMREVVVLLKVFSKRYSIWKSSIRKDMADFKTLDEKNIEKWVSTNLSRLSLSPDPFVTTLPSGRKKNFFFLPVRTETGFYGWILATRIFQKIGFSTDYAKLMRTLTSSLASALERLIREREKSIRAPVTIRDFTEIALDRSKLIHPEQVFSFVLSLLHPNFRWETAVIYFYHPDKKSFIPVTSHGVPVSRVKPVRIDMNSSLIKSMLNEKNVLYRSIQNGHTGKIKSYSVHSRLWSFTPMFYHNKVVGGVVIEKRKKQRFTLQEHSTLKQILEEAYRINRQMNDFIRAENYNLKILDSLSVAVVVLDHRLDVLLINRVFDEIFKPETADGKTRILAEIISRMDMSRSVKGGSSVEFDIDTGSGRVPVNVSATLLQDGPRNFYGHVLVIEDISKQKIIEDKMARAQRLASLGEIAAGIAHEIRNPLTSLRGFSQLLPKKFNDKDFRTRFCVVLQREIDRLNNLVENLMSFSRPGTGEFYPVSIQKTIDNTLALLSPQMHENKITLNKIFRKTDLIILGDEYKLEQVFLNICLNAIHSMEGNRGSITIEFKKSNHVYIERRNPVTRSSVHIRISDTGGGMSEENLKQLFTPFFTTKKEGAGLGLSIVQRIIQELGGEIEVKSRLNKGTRVNIYIPECNKSAMGDKYAVDSSH